MAKAIHTMIRVRELDRSIDFYDRAFGLKVAERLDFDDFTLVYLRNPENDFEIELTWNRDQEGAYTHGSGYGHVALAVDDPEAGQRTAPGRDAPRPVLLRGRPRRVQDRGVGASRAVHVGDGLARGILLPTH